MDKFFASLLGLNYGRFNPFTLRGCFDGAGGAGTGGGGAGAGTGGAGTGDPPPGGGKGDEGKGQPFAVFPDEATFMSRVKREGKSQLEALAKEMGFESADAMKAAAKAKKETDDAAKSDLEKEKLRADKAEQEVKSAKDAANRVLITAEIKVLAIKSGFHDPEDVVALADRSQITVNDQGKVTGAKEAVEALAKAKPHLLGKGGGGQVGSGSNPGGQGGGDPVEEARKKAEERNKGSQQASGGYNPWAK